MLDEFHSMHNNIKLITQIPVIALLGDIGTQNSGENGD